MEGKARGLPRGDGGNIRQDAGGALAHCCAIFLCYLGRDDHHRNPTSNGRDHLAGQYKAGCRREEC